MNVIKAPQANIETYLYNDFNIEIFDDLTESEEWKDLFEPLEFFNFLYIEFEFFEKNAERYLEIKKHFGKLKLKDKKRYYFLWALIELTSKKYPTSEYCEGVIVKSLEYVEGMYDIIKEELYPENLNEVSTPIKNYDFSKVKSHINTLHDVKDKIKYLTEIKTEYLQNDNGGLLEVPMWNETTFDTKCDLEIKKLEVILKLDTPKQITVKKEMNGNCITPTFKLKDSVISKIDFIRVVNAMQELRAFETSNGTLATKKDVMQAFGNIVGIDLINYDKDLNKAFTSNVSIETNLEIFEKMKSKTQEIFLSKQNKPKN
jgi:hypothetical protein